jgi:hypothetical protein
MQTRICGGMEPLTKSRNLAISAELGCDPATTVC